MISPSPQAKTYAVKRPDGKIFDVPESNLDWAIQEGGVILDEDPVDATQPVSLSVSQPEENSIQPTSSPQKMYAVKRPDGKIFDVPESNLQKAKDLGGMVIEEESQEQPKTKHEYTGENTVAAFAKNIGAGAIGALPDIAIGLNNAQAATGRPVIDIETGEEFPAAQPIPLVTDIISDKIDQATGGYTKDTGAISKYAARFLGSLFGAGGTGKAIEALGAAGKLGKASEAAKSTGSFIAKNLGITSPSVANVSGALAGGSAIGFAEENDIPIQYQIPLILGSFILGHGAGNKASSIIKDSEALKPLFDRIPGLQQSINKGHYKDLAKNIDENSIADLLKTSLIEKETEFLTQKTLSELSPEIRSKIENNSALLTDAEVDQVIQKGMSDFTSQIENLEKEYFPLTTGEYTGSPKIIAKEDALANKPNVENFDIALRERRNKISKRIEKIKNDLTSKVSSSEELGKKIAQEVETVYSDARKMRTDNWNKGYGKAVDEPILPIDDFKNKLQEFAKLRPDTEGNIVAIKAAKRRLNDGLSYEQKISPRRYNDILVGLNEEIRRFPDKTFSQKQMLELKAAAESGLDKAIKNAATQEQASIIRNVRSQFAEDSKIIDQIDDSILFSKIGSDKLKIPEQIAKTLDNMPASQLKLTFDALKRSNNYHEIIPEVQRYYIENAFKAATKDGPDSFNPRIFMDKLPKKPEFEVIFDGTNAYQEIKDMSVLFKRMRKFQPSRHNSKTVQRAQADRGDLEEVAEAATKAANGDWLSSFKSLLDAGTSSSYDRKIADILLSSSDRKRILEQVGSSPNKKKTAVTIQAVSNMLK